MDGWLDRSYLNCKAELLKNIHEYSYIKLLSDFLFPISNTPQKAQCVQNVLLLEQGDRISAMFKFDHFFCHLEEENGSNLNPLEFFSRQKESALTLNGIMALGSQCLCHSALHSWYCFDITIPTFSVLSSTQYKVQIYLIFRIY